MIITYFRMNAMSIGQFLSIFSNGILHCIINVISYLKAFHTFMLNIHLFFSYYYANYFNLNIMILSSKLILQFFPCIARVQQLVFSKHVLVLCSLFFVFFPIINLQSKEPNPKPRSQSNPKPISPTIKSINPSNQQSTTTESNLPKFPCNQQSLNIKSTKILS